MRAPDTVKASKKKAPVKVGTGVKASRHEDITSTNISSPVKGGNKRRLAQYAYHDSDESDGSSFETMPPPRTSKSASRAPSAYRKDGFVVSDHIDPDDFEDDDGIFAPVREAGKPRKKRRNSLGTPITVDERMQSLNKHHRLVLEDFLYHAREENQKVLFAKSLRAAPFTDTILTEMAIQFPKNKDEMLRIEGIDSEKVSLYHHKFLPLIRNAEKRYQDYMEQEADRPNDPNHKTVVDLCSDDNDDTGNTADGLGSSQDEQSSYFHQPDSDVVDFNKQMQQLQSDRLAQRPKPQPSAPTDEGGGRRSWGGGEGNGKRASFKKSRKSGGSNGEWGSSRFPKKRGGGPTGNSGARTNKPSGGQRTFAAGGISMMPT